MCLNRPNLQRLKQEKRVYLTPDVVSMYVLRCILLETQNVQRSGKLRRVRDEEGIENKTALEGNNPAIRYS